MMDAFNAYCGAERDWLCDEKSWNYIEASSIAGPKAPELKPKRPRKTKIQIAAAKAAKAAKAATEDSITASSSDRE
jgi:hypothetical protein